MRSNYFPSECSDSAVKFAAAMLHKQVKPLHVTILYVDALMPERVAGALGEEAIARIHRENVEFALRGGRFRLEQAGVLFAESHHPGSVVEHICQIAEQGNFDLILMDSHGGSAVAGQPDLGSTTARVLAGSKVPVLVVR